MSLAGNGLTLHLLHKNALNASPAEVWAYICTSRTNFGIQTGSVDPDQTAPGFTLFATKTLLKNQQMTHSR